MSDENLPAKVRFDVVVGAVLAHFRTLHGAPQSRVAELARLPTSTWSRLESGISGMSLAQMLKATRALETHPNVFIETIDRVLEALEGSGFTVTWPARGEKLDTNAWYLDSVSVRNLLAAIEPRKAKPEA